MNNIKVLTTILQEVDSGGGDNWHKLKAIFFLNLIKMDVNKWDDIVNSLALEAVKSETYYAGDIVNKLERLIVERGFYVELYNAGRENVASHADRMLLACIENSYQVRGALKLFFEEKVEFLKCGRIPIIKNKRSE